jgi:hypothetical protein
MNAELGLCSCWKRQPSRWKVAGEHFDVLMEEALIFQHLSCYLQIIFMREIFEMLIFFPFPLNGTELSQINLLIKS